MRQKWQSWVLPTLCTWCAFPWQSLVDVTSPVICLVSCVEGGMLSLTTLSLAQTLTDQVKKKHLISVILEVLEYQWAGKIKANYKHSPWHDCVVGKEPTLGAALLQELMEITPRSQKCQCGLWFPSGTTAGAISWCFTVHRLFPRTVASLPPLQTWNKLHTYLHERGLNAGWRVHNPLNPLVLLGHQRKKKTHQVLNILIPVWAHSWVAASSSLISNRLCKCHRGKQSLYPWITERWMALNISVVRDAVQ